MASTPMNAAAARRRARGALLATVGGGVAAAGLWALEIPGLRHEPVVRTTADQLALAGGDAPGQTPAVAPVAFTRESAMEVAERLSRAWRKAEEPKPPEADPVEVPPVAAPSSPGETEWKYLAGMRAGSRTLAVVTINGEQRVVSEGMIVHRHDASSSAEVVRVTRDQVVIREGERERTIERSAKSGAGVEWATIASNAPPASASGGVAGAPSMGGIPPGMAEQMRARGIDPNQAARMREFFRERRNSRGRGEPGGGRGTLRNNGDGTTTAPVAPMESAENNR